MCYSHKWMWNQKSSLLAIQPKCHERSGSKNEFELKIAGNSSESRTALYSKAYYYEVGSFRIVK